MISLLRSSILVPLNRWRRKRNWDHFWSQGQPARWELHGVSRHVALTFEQGWLQPRSTLLDIGCGASHNAAWLAARGLYVYAADLSPIVIRQAAERFRGTSGLEFIQADFSRPVRGIPQVDSILDRGCLHGLDPETWPEYFRNITGLLKEGGVYLLLAAKERGVEEYVSTQLPTCLAISFAQSIEMLESNTASSVPGMFYRIRRTESGLPSPVQGPSHAKLTEPRCNG